jgi:D-sedoheptulose 7-phosphate isomerase
MTACGNDYSYEVYYQRMTQALGRPGDVLIGITTSGKSNNVILALKAAREMGITTLGFLGGDGGPALADCDLALIAPTRETGRVQEIHITAGHALMELIEEMLLSSGYLTNSQA